MTKNEIFIKVEEIFKDVFDDENLIITRDTYSKDIEDWDSLSNINLLVAMEKEFKIKFNLQEVQKLKNIGDMLDMIEEKVSK